MQSGSLPRIDHFEIERLLHEGGMGILYLARDTRRGAWVVLKVSRQVKPRADHDRERTAAEQAFYEEALQAGVSPRPRDRPSGYQTKQYPVPTAGSGGDRGRARGFRPRPAPAGPRAGSGDLALYGSRANRAGKRGNGSPGSAAGGYLCPGGGAVSNGDRPPAFRGAGSGPARSARACRPARRFSGGRSRPRWMI